MNDARWRGYLGVAAVASRRAVRVEDEAAPYWRYQVRAERHLLAALGEASRFGETDRRVATTLQQLFSLYRYVADYAGTEWVCRRLVDCHRALAGQDSPASVQFMQELALACWVNGKHDEADQLYRDSVTICQRVVGPEQPLMLSMLWGAGMHFQAAAEGVAYWERAAELAKQLKEHGKAPIGFPLSRVLDELAGCYAKHGQHDRAELTWRRVVAERERGSDFDRRQLCYPLMELAKACRSQGKLAEAEVAWRRSLEIFEAGPSALHVYWIIRDLAAICEETGRPEEAEDLYLRALALRDRSGRPSASADEPHALELDAFVAEVFDAGFADVMRDYSRFLRDHGRPIEAVAIYERLIGILESPRPTSPLPERFGRRRGRDFVRSQAVLAALADYATDLRDLGRLDDADAASSRAAVLRDILRRDRRAHARRSQQQRRRALARRRTEPPFLTMRRS